MAVSPKTISVDPYTSLSSTDHNVYHSLDNATHNDSGSGNAGTSVKSTRGHRLITVSLGVLCAILLMSTITLSALYTAEISKIEEQCQTGSACPEGWKEFSSKCYLFSADKKNWTDSRAYCEIRGADLVVIKSQDKQEFINKCAVGEHYWIGMEDQSPGFTWVDGTILRNEDARWKPGAPDVNRRQNENCVFTGPNEQLWGDTQCYKLHRWICEH